MHNMTKCNTYWKCILYSSVIVPTQCKCIIYMWCETSSFLLLAFLLLSFVLHSKRSKPVFLKGAAKKATLIRFLLEHPAINTSPPWGHSWHSSSLFSPCRTSCCCNFHNWELLHSKDFMQGPPDYCLTMEVDVHSLVSSTCVRVYVCTGTGM